MQHGSLYPCWLDYYQHQYRLSVCGSPTLSFHVLHLANQVLSKCSPGVNCHKSYVGVLENGTLLPSDHFCTWVYVTYFMPLRLIRTGCHEGCLKRWWRFHSEYIFPLLWWQCCLLQEWRRLQKRWRWHYPLHSSWSPSSAQLTAGFR